MIALSYHDRTKHHFNRFARSVGYLDWATQPDPFRRYRGAPLLDLSRTAHARDVPYEALFGDSVAAVQVDLESIGEFLRCSMGLSAWKQYAATRWALRVNPSSGNLHPTEGYVVYNGRTFHYAPREHALEERCALAERWKGSGPTGDCFLVALTSIHWREAWKYGERAFRYCQHDVGHALCALRLSAAMQGWRLALLPAWGWRDIAQVLGVDRDEDYDEAEREEPELLAIVGAGDLTAWRAREPGALVSAAAQGAWRGHANRLSRNHVEWEVVAEVTGGTRYPGQSCDGARCEGATVGGDGAQVLEGATVAPLSARSVILSRRSAVAFDGRSSLSRHAFFSMLRRLRPQGPPWDAIDWLPHVHLVLFVHRVEDLTPGIYAFFRDEGTQAEWRESMRKEFLWEAVSGDDGADSGHLFLLVPADVRPTAMRLSCDQSIAADGFFSLAMIARVEESLRERGEWFYPRLFWECGMIGHILYLEAEAAGGRGTGIGCFYDDPVHDLLGLTGHQWQSLYHFSMGVPVEDTRLTTEPGYSWETSSLPV